MGMKLKQSRLLEERKQTSRCSGQSASQVGLVNLAMMDYKDLFCICKQVNNPTAPYKLAVIIATPDLIPYC